jgi:arabinose operon protein AraL
MKIPIDGFVFDLDGTLYLGEHALPGAVETMAALRRGGKRVVFISNKPLEPGCVYAEKLTRLGIPAAPEEVITSALVLGRALANDYAGLRCYVLGEEALKSELRVYGIDVVAETAQDSRQVIDPAGIDAVIVAFDRTLDYRKLNTAYQALSRGCRFFATNADRTCPMPGGAIPDAGATLAALEHMTGRKPELVGGKPSPLMLCIASEILQYPPERCLLAGDRLETDIRMAQQAGFHSAVVLTGVTRREDLNGMEHPPELVLENIGQLMDFVE